MGWDEVAGWEEEVGEERKGEREWRRSDVRRWSNGMVGREWGWNGE